MVDMFIKIKFLVNTDTKNIYFLNKRNVYIPHWNLNIFMVTDPG